jgi:hypothetical protein
MLESRFISGASKPGRPAEDFYPTPEWCTEELLKRETFEGSILEPCAGSGGISNVLIKKGLEVYTNDIVNRGITLNYEKNMSTEYFSNESFDNVVCDPPYKYMNDFLIKSLLIARKKVAFFVKLSFLESKARYDIFKNEEFPLSKVLVFSKRPQRYRNGENIKASSTYTCCWVIFDREYTGEPTIDFVL